MTKPDNPIRGFIFDMDGTLIDSQLDFDQIRRDMRLADGVPILETIQSMDGDRRVECERILTHHEQKGVENSSVFPNVAITLLAIERLKIPMAIVTRNRSDFALQMLELLPVKFDIVIGRDDGPIKPDPWAPLHVCNRWGIRPNEAVMTGDYIFDIQSGNSAGCFTVLFTQGREQSTLSGLDDANWIMSDFSQMHDVIADWTTTG